MDLGGGKKMMEGTARKMKLGDFVHELTNGWDLALTYEIQRLGRVLEEIKDATIGESKVEVSYTTHHNNGYWDFWIAWDVVGVTLEEIETVKPFITDKILGPYGPNSRIKISPIENGFRITFKY